MAALAFRESRFAVGKNRNRWPSVLGGWSPGPAIEGGKKVDNKQSERPADILDLASERRRERQVVDVEQQKTLLVVFELVATDAAPAQKTETRAAPPAAPVAEGAAAQREPAPELAGNSYFSLPASLVESIVLIQEITYVPGTPDWILGVVNVRGEIESVLDLKAVLGYAPGRRTELQAESRLLIAQHGQLRSGLLVGRVIDIAEIPVSSISAAPLPQEGGKGVYVQGEADYFGRPLLILDLPMILQRALEGDRV
jgi:purine-binding chemotaxis protein CheW